MTWNCAHWLDITGPWPFPAGSVRYVYGDNVIEHISLRENRELVRHARAVMAPGGTIRPCTPDTGRLVGLYQSADADTRDALEWHQSQGHLAFARRRPAPYRIRNAWAPPRLPVGHRGLSAELDAAGFINPRRCDAGASSDPVLRG